MPFDVVIHTLVDLLYFSLDAFHGSHCLVVVFSILSTEALHKYDNNTAGGED